MSETTVDPLREQLLAGEFDDPQAAGAEMLGALEEIPIHFGVTNYHIWQFSPSTPKAGKWCWSFSISAAVGGYSTPWKPEGVIRAERRRCALGAIVEAKPYVDE